MARQSSRLLVIQVAALSDALIKAYPQAFAPLELAFAPLMPVFPAVTCTVQATLRTGLAPAEHGIISNGLFFPERMQTEFWNQSARLLPKARIWDRWRQAGRSVGVVCWQQSLGDSLDLVLSPAPVHKHHGGMIQDCYSQPPGLYQTLCHAVGCQFNLMHYWGPLASLKSTQWISQATAAVLADAKTAPDLLLTYLPHLDYALQKAGPDATRKVEQVVQELAAELKMLVAAARHNGYGVVVFGDYAIVPARQVVRPNLLLRQAGLFQVRSVRHMTYPDLYRSAAFAMVDHQIAHVYVQDPAQLPAVRQCLSNVAGIDAVLDHTAIANARSGQLILRAAPDAWFAYPWWDNNREAPDYATHVDIHNKIGFDPAELFWGWPPPSISLDSSRVAGTHGRNDVAASYASDIEFATPVQTQLDLAQALRQWLDAHQ